MANQIKLIGTRCLREIGICTSIAFGMFFNFGVLSAQVRINIDAANVKNHINPLMYGSCIEDVNHEIYGGLYDQKIFGESFEEDFFGMTIEGFESFGGKWEVSDNQLSVKADEGAKLIRENPLVGDGRVEVELKFGENIEIAGLIVRVGNAAVGADNFDGYEVSLNALTKRIVLGKHVQNWQPIQEADADFNPANWNRIQVELSGATIRLYLNDNPNPLINYTDNSTPLLSGKIGLRTWKSDVSFRNLKIETNQGTAEVHFNGSITQCGQWDIIRENAGALFSLDTENPFNGKLSQKIDYPGGSGKAGLINGGLNRWGIAVKSGQNFQGRVYLRSENFAGAVSVALQSADGTSIYAVQQISGLTGSWTKYPFTLTANATDPNARFAIWMENSGTLWMDQVVLEGTGEERFHGLPYRADIGNAMVAEGLNFLRYGGTMVNAAEYRFKKMIGDPDLRPPYRGHWYPYSTNGFGIEDFLKFCEAAGFEPAFAINIEETAQDAADMVEYLNGATSTTWGAKRAENGHPEPYRVKYIEIGNEEAIESDNAQAYNHYVERFNDLYAAMISKDANLQVINSAWWRPDSPYIRGVFLALNGKAAYWDYHPWADEANSGTGIENDLIRMENLFKQWDPNTTMKCAIFEENGNLHNLQRALGHATILNATRRRGEFLLTSCAANALQPYKQNENGWDQGQVFFTPSQVWGMPTFYAQQIASSNHLPLRIWEDVTGSLDVTATRSEEGETVVIHVVNTMSVSRNTKIKLNNFVFNGVANVWCLSGRLGDENTPEEPEKIIPVENTINIESDEFDYVFTPYSYTIIRLSGGKTTGMPVKKTAATNVVRQGDDFLLTYPSNVTSASIYNLAGQHIDEYSLSSGGICLLPAGNLSKGVYILTFNGEKTNTVKLLK